MLKRDEERPPNTWRGGRGSRGYQVARSTHHGTTLAADFDWVWMRPRRKDERHATADVDSGPSRVCLRQDSAWCGCAGLRLQRPRVDAETKLCKNVNSRTKRQPCDIRNADGRRWRPSPPRLGPFSRETTRYETAAEEPQGGETEDKAPLTHLHVPYAASAARISGRGRLAACRTTADHQSGPRHRLIRSKRRDPWTTSEAPIPSSAVISARRGT